MLADNNEQRLWYQKGVGQRLIQAESEQVTAFLPRLYGYHLVFLGDPGLITLVQASLISHRIVVDPHQMSEHQAYSPLQGEMSAIPLRTDSVDVVVLSHVLEHVANPHDVLRETHRVLIPEGHVLITGFNPFSLWGIWHVIQKWLKAAPQPGKMLSAGRVRDWLTLLNFQIVGGQMFYFRPPINHEGICQKLNFMERWGARWFSIFGGAYSILAVKRVVPLTPVRAKFKIGKPIWEGVTEGIPKPSTTANQSSHE